MSWATVERRGMVMQAINRRQAMVPRGAVVLENSRGTAPGLWIEREGTGIALLPGPPREMKPMLEALVVDRLAPKTSGAGLFRRVLKITGQPESEVDARAQPIYGRWLTAPVPIATTILAVMGQIELHLSASAKNKADADEALDAAVNELAQHLGPMVYSSDGRGREVVIGDILRAKHFSIAVAESCSGGLLSWRLTDVLGSWLFRLRRGLLRNAAKIDWLGVPEPLTRARRGQRAGGARDGGRRVDTRRLRCGDRHHRYRWAGRRHTESRRHRVDRALTPNGDTIRRSSSWAAATWSSFSRQAAMNMLRLPLLDAQLFVRSS